VKLRRHDIILIFGQKDDGGSQMSERKKKDIRFVFVCLSARRKLCAYSSGSKLLPLGRVLFEGEIEVLFFPALDGN
jgi:hypothetical protein